MSCRALVILHPGFEETEAVAPIDILFRAQVDLVLASTSDHVEVESRCGLKVRAVTTLDAVAEHDYDLVFLPGGPGIQKIRKHPGICALFRRQAAAGRWLACICAAPLLLKDAGLADGIGLTCHPSAASELAPVSPATVVEAGTILTSRGAGTAIEFALALVRKLKDDATAESIAEAICVSK